MSLVLRVNLDGTRRGRGLGSLAMAKNKIASRPCGAVPLSIEQLEAGLQRMTEEKSCASAFWEENIWAFGQTVLFAIRETSDALLSPAISLRARLELENQLEALLHCFELADRYIARRSSTPTWPDPEPRSAPRRFH